MTDDRQPPAQRSHLLALDLDGTLLSHDKQILPRTRAALATLEQRGWQITVATGRSIEVARYFCQGLSLSGPQITYNGAVIYDALAERVVACALMPAVGVTEALAFLYERGISTAVFTTSAVYLDPHMTNPEAWSPGTTQRPEIIADLAVLATQPCIKVVGYADAATIARLRPEAEALLGASLYVTQTATDLLEFLSPGVSKGAALLRVAADLKIARAQTIAFGDSHNDSEMLRDAGVGVAMGNASDELKAIADLVTTSNDDEGIAEALARLGFVDVAP